jgi:tetratricopeptide (TPR) repeat protein
LTDTRLSGPRRHAEKRHRGAFLVLLGGLLLAARPAGAQWHKNQYQLQKEAAERYEPAPLAIQRRASSGAPVRLRVRFYTDREYRSSGGPQWQERVRVQLSQLNRLLEPAFGVRLEADSFRRWDRKGPNGALAPMLEELERLDPATDVDWVVGLVAPLPLISNSFHDLGWARVLSRHFVLRSMSSIPELDEFNRMFRALDRQQREALYTRRKEHRELAVFLHEWAHTLGAFHLEDPRRIMAAALSNESSAIGASEADLIAAGLSARQKSQGQDAIDWAPLQRFLADHSGQDWPVHERAALEGALASSGAGGKPMPGSRSPRILPPGAAPAFVGEAHAHLRGNRRPEALAVARRAAAGLGASDADGWLALGRLYIEIGALSAAEEALVRAGASPGATQAAGELQRQRRSFGLPRSIDQKKASRFRLAPEAEPDFVAAVLEVRALVAGTDPAGARRTADQKLRRYPNAPVLLTLACEASLLSERTQEAARSCAQALAIMEELPRAHYLTGIMAANAGRYPAAIKSLRRAIDLAPDQISFWRPLGEVYRVTGRTEEFEALMAAHAQATSAAPPAAPPP